MQNERHLPALLTPEVMVLERPIVRPKMFKTIWSKVVMVRYQKTANALLSVRELVDNRDLALVKSSKEGISEISLSLIDLWSGKGPFPSISEINRIIAQIGKEPVGISEMVLFAKAINHQPIVVPSDYCLAIATRDYLEREGISQFPSVSQDEEHGVMLGLTYDWIIEKHHVYVLVMETL
ncbi:MAG: hypothetical protein HY931_03790 [Candidatus Falkowbacteria bacterium]|nr:MAG: hypothetical protein HY931_03790 [Candidatus Falkowbacteria bacterium]